MNIAGEFPGRGLYGIGAAFFGVVLCGGVRFFFNLLDSTKIFAGIVGLFFPAGFLPGEKFYCKIADYVNVLMDWR